MTVIAKDRPGLVEVLAGLVADHEGNWLESRMAHLGGQFAGILRVELPPGREEPLLAALRALGGRGVSVTVQPDDETAPAGPGRVADLKVIGADRPGVVRQISRELARSGVNVEELSTERLSAPMTGEPLFQAEARVWLPESCPPGDLREALERIAQDLMADVSFTEILE